MSLNANYQKLEPGDEVRLLEIDGQAFGLDEVLYFHGCTLLGFYIPILTREL